MPYKNTRKRRGYSRVYMRKLRATKKGLTIKPNQLNPVKPVIVKPNVKPTPCLECQALATIKKSYRSLQKQLAKLQVATENPEPIRDIHEYWRQQKRKQYEKKKLQKLRKLKK